MQASPGNTTIKIGSLARLSHGTVVLITKDPVFSARRGLHFCSKLGNWTDHNNESRPGGVGPSTLHLLSDKLHCEPWDLQVGCGPMSAVTTGKL